MRLLVDEHDVPWDEAWAITCQSFAYTNHTLLPEALEQWPLPLFSRVLPRHLEILLEINARFLDEVRIRFYGDSARLTRLSLIDEHGERHVRMTNGLRGQPCHQWRGGAAFAPDARRRAEGLLRHVAGEIHQHHQRRDAAALAGAIQPAPVETGVRGDRQGLDLGRGAPACAGAACRRRRLPPSVAGGAAGEQARPCATGAPEHGHGGGSGIDVRCDGQAHPRIQAPAPPCCISSRSITASSAIRTPTSCRAPSSSAARRRRLPIRQADDPLHHQRGRCRQPRPQVRDRLKVVFLPNFNVTCGQRIYPAADLSEQISLAGKEASGTGNMKFAMNGALTIGTLDGANIELRDAIGADNFFDFGLSVPQVQALREDGYDASACYRGNAELRAVMDLIRQGFFSHGDATRFDLLFDEQLRHDPYFLLADFASYVDCQRQASAAFSDPARWQRMSVLSCARSGWFSSDRAIREYCDRIWKVKAVPVRLLHRASGAPRHAEAAARGRKP